ncbi:PREDICTED: uncharacterized protein LOC108562901 [Nicrophorus vespilloides]|uniref:Uncharacterized protein LOC108562901 n=1 Tax=Nicrophorus vespilloides TaxID=110193 RepID=A0ABM1MQP1_NICVS|nr:PREDICTED: uncharacterized protein LOC108562901 [Nicrophorus vespilloides]
MLHPANHHRNNDKTAMDQWSLSNLDEYPRAKKSKQESKKKLRCHITKSSSTKGNWEMLPAAVVDNVFKYLKFNDVKSASSACRNWRHGLYHPRLWQHVRFEISEKSLQRSRYLRNMVGHMVTDATVVFGSMSKDCIEEFLALLECFTFSNQLQSLMLKPSHCHVLHPDETKWQETEQQLIELFMKITEEKSMTRLSFGCLEQLQQKVIDILHHLANVKPDKITTLGLATVKDDPSNYLLNYYDPQLITPFQNLEILSVDYDVLTDLFLDGLKNCRNLNRLVVHVHGVWDGHPGTSENAWKNFKEQHPDCRLRLSLIHAFDEVAVMHNTILRDNMPLSHLRVLFCEGLNIIVLEKLLMYKDTFVSLSWVDCVDMDSRYNLIQSDTPPNIIMLAWLCNKLEEMRIIGYKFFDQDWIGVAKLRSNTLKKLEISSTDILDSDLNFNIFIELPLILGKSCKILNRYDLHPVFLDNSSADSDEYLLPILLADLQ